MRWIRPVVSILLLGLLLKITDFSQVLVQLSLIPPGYVVTALLLFLISILISTFKWRLSLPDTRYLALLRCHLSSFFFFLLPTGTLGAEASKLTVSVTEGIRLSIVAASITLDKLTGLTALALVGAVAGILGEHPQAKLAAAALALTAAAIVIAVLIARSGRRLSPVFTKFGKPGRSVASLVESIADLGSRPGLIWQNLVVGVLAQGVVIAIYACMANGLGLGYPLPEFVVCVVVANLAAVLPVSLAGIGVREVGLVALLAQLGIDAEAATALALSVFSIFLVGSMAGFINQLLPIKPVQKG